MSCYLDRKWYRQPNMNWYKKASYKSQTFGNYKISYSYCGINFEGETSPGKHHPDPEDMPEVDLIDAQIEDIKGLWDYIDWIEEDFTRTVEEEIKSRISTFGNIDEPLLIVINGIRFIIKVDKSNTNPSNWVIIGAEIVDIKNFLNTLPEKLREHVEEGMLNIE